MRFAAAERQRMAAALFGNSDAERVTVAARLFDAALEMPVCADDAPALIPRIADASQCARELERRACFLGVALRLFVRLQASIYTAERKT